MMGPAVMPIREMDTHQRRPINHIGGRTHNRSRVNNDRGGPHDDWDGRRLDKDCLRSGFNNHLLHRLLNHNLLHRNRRNHSRSCGNNRRCIHRRAMVMGSQDAGQGRARHNSS